MSLIDKKASKVLNSRRSPSNLAGTTITIVPHQRVGKGRGQRKKKNLKQIEDLDKVFKAKPLWSNDDVSQLAACTKLTKTQVYKWNWDMRKRFCPKLVKPPKLKKRSPIPSPRNYIAPIRSKVTLETIQEAQPLFPPIGKQEKKKKI